MQIFGYAFPAEETSRKTYVPGNKLSAASPIGVIALYPSSVPLVSQASSTPKNVVYSAISKHFCL